MMLHTNTPVSLVVVAVSVLFVTVNLVSASSDSTSIEDISNYPYLLYVLTPFSACFGAFLTDQLVITDARCLYPFSKDDKDVPSTMSGTIEPKYLMAAIPTANISQELNIIQKSTELYKKNSDAQYRATTFMGLIQNYANNRTFIEVDYAGVQSKYPQSEFSEPAQQNFDVGIIHLTVPVKNAKHVRLQIDDISSETDVVALTFEPPNKSKSPAVQQDLYNGSNLAKVSKIDTSLMKQSQCDSNYKDAYGLKDFKSFVGSALPDNKSPIYCSTLYSNITECDLDTGISINKNGDNIRSENTNSTVYLIPSISSTEDTVLVSIGRPHVFEVRSSKSTPCSSNGVVHFPRIGLYTEWIGFATNGSIANNGSWVNETKSGNAIDKYKNGSSQSIVYSTTTAILVSIFAALYWGISTV